MTLSENNIFYVYGLYDNNIPFYIGKGHGSRALNHIGIARRGSHLPVHKKIRSMQREPTVKMIYNNLSEKDAYSKEVELISEIGMRRNKTGPLLNLLPGGVGGGFGSITVLTEPQVRKKNNALKTIEVRRRISKGVKNSSRHLTEEGRAKLSLAHKGKKTSQVTRFKISVAKKGIPGWKKTKEQKAAVSKRNMGRVLSSETKKKISDSVKRTGMTIKQKARQKEAVLKQVECPHCGKVGARSIMMRWHFGNCKKRLN